jgi:hypothetical protein
MHTSSVRLSAYVLSLATLLIASAPLAHADDDLEATPYRPGVGSPSVVSAKGYFELEAGYEYTKAADVRGDNLGLLLKYGITDELGLMVGWSPYLKVSSTDASISGNSDLNLGLKYITKPSKDIAIGGQVITTLPTGSRDFRSDKPTVTVTGIAGFDYGPGLHSDINLGITRAGDDPGAGISRNTYAWSVGFNPPPQGKLSSQLEISGNTQSGAGRNTQLLGSLSYNVSKLLVLDMYLARARNSFNGADVYTTTAGTGFTYLFTK